MADETAQKTPSSPGKEDSKTRRKSTSSDSAQDQDTDTFEDAVDATNRDSVNASDLASAMMSVDADEVIPSDAAQHKDDKKEDMTDAQASKSESDTAEPTIKIETDNEAPKVQAPSTESEPAEEKGSDAGSVNDGDQTPVDPSATRSLTQRSFSSSQPGDNAEPAPADENTQESTSRLNLTVDAETDSIDDRSNYSNSKREDDIDSSAEDGPNTRRLSVASNLDDVNLGDENPKDLPTPPVLPAAISPLPSAVEPETKPQDGQRALSLSSILPWSPSTESPAKSPSLAAVAGTSPVPPPQEKFAPPTRKLTSPFSWLSRNSSKDKDAQLPSAQTSPRRNTASSIATITSNPEMMLSKLDEEEGEDKKAMRNSLKDRFKMLRMREEAGVTIGEEEELAPAARSRSDSAKIETLKAGDSTPSAEQPPLSPVPSAVDNLAPGTVSGPNAGPSAMDENVDWDLWQSVVYEGPAAVARTSAEELNRAIATGIPSAIRGVIWQVLAQSKNDDLEAVYKELATRGPDSAKHRESGSTTISHLSNTNLSVHSGEAGNSSASSVHSEGSGDNKPEVPPKSPLLEAERLKKTKDDAAALLKLEKVIKRDMGARTSYSKYAASAGLQDGLFGVCKAYALFDEAVGYAQGMNFLIMPLLFNMPEQEAFCLLVRLMNQYHLRDLFIQDMPGLHKSLYQFERLLEDFEPALYCHLHRRGISPHLYATQWFLTLFAYRFPLQLVLRIYDLIFSEGLSAILRFGIVLMQKNATTLLGMSDMQQLTTFLKDKIFDVYIDKDPSSGSLLENGFFGSSSASMDKEVYRADQLVRDACEVKITPETLKMYATEWEEKTKAEQDRETELHDLRIGHQKLQLKVRQLEERVEVCDREQAALATELVHTKVENEELKDENESMKGQVTELRSVIERQPEEIESAWKDERDNLMKRNQNVHEENQKLEKELTDLEDQLVQTKLKYAEVNDQYEEMNRKWADLRRQMG